MFVSGFLPFLETYRSISGTKSKGLYFLILYNQCIAERSPFSATKFFPFNTPAASWNAWQASWFSETLSLDKVNTLIA